MADAVAVEEAATAEAEEEAEAAEAADALMAAAVALAVAEIADPAAMVRYLYTAFFKGDVFAPMST